MPHPTNPIEEMILDNVARLGWHCNSVGTDHDSSIFAYTVGFYHSYGHPELLVFGLAPRTAHRMFMAAARKLVRGQPLDTNTVHAGLMRGRKCVLVDVPGDRYVDIVLSACWFYGNNQFPVCQVVWPCKRGMFPWHANAPRSLVAAQPILGSISTGA